jgi:hypothetical protein
MAERILYSLVNADWLWLQQLKYRSQALGGSHGEYTGSPFDQQREAKYSLVDDRRILG